MRSALSTLRLTNKNWTDRYEPGITLDWQGRSDGVPNAVRIHEIINAVDLNHLHSIPATGKRWGIIGFACDVGVRRNQGRAGAAGGPLEIRRALAKYPVADPIQTHFLDFGDVTCPDGDLEETQDFFANVLAMLFDHGIQPIILGGGHELAWAHYLGLTRAFPTENFGIVNFDAHYDLRPTLPEEKGTSGTSFLQIAHHTQSLKRPFDYTVLGLQPLSNTQSLHNTARDLGVTVVTADAIQGRNPHEAESAIARALANNKRILLSICMDVFASASAPAVSAPQPLGLMPWQVTPLLERIAQSQQIAGFHIAELIPDLDKEGLTASLAAALVATLVSC